MHKLFQTNINFLNLVTNNFIKDKRFLKFVFVGIINTIFGYSIYALLIMLGVHYTLAMLCSTIIGSLFNFKTTGKIVFKNTKNNLIFRFLFVYVAMYLFNMLVIKSCVFLNYNLYLSGVIALFFAVPISFLLNRAFVFRGKYEAN